MRHQLYHYILFFLVLVAGCKPSEITPTKPLSPEEEQLVLGNPSAATSDVANYNNYIMMKPQYAFSYSRDRGSPNWVGWHVNKDWIGSATRQNDFRADATLPEGWYRIKTSDYSGTSFDRGHNVPSADRTRTEADNSVTFLMANIIHFYSQMLFN